MPITSITGVLVPVLDFPRLRDVLYSAVTEVIRSEKDKLQIPPTLKYSSLLPDYPDEIKFRVIEGIVEVVLSENIPILRLGYYTTDELIMSMPYLADFRYQVGLCWFNLHFIIQPLCKDDIIIPVLDAGFNQAFQKSVDLVSSSQKTTAIMRVSGLADSISFENSHNVTDVLFADDEHSMFLQLTDVISGLRRDSETVRETGTEPNSAYKQQMLSLSERLTPALKYERVIKMKFNRSPAA